MAQLFRIVLVAGCLLGLGVVWAYPKLITGDYSDVVIDKIQTDARGHTDVSFSTLTSDNTAIIEAFWDGNKYMGGGSGAGGGIFGRPSRGMIEVNFDLRPETFAAGAQPAPSTWRQRLLVKEGGKREIHDHERMYFYDFTTSDGIRHDGYMEIEPQ